MIPWLCPSTWVTCAYRLEAVPKVFEAEFELPLVLLSVEELDLDAAVELHVQELVQVPQLVVLELGETAELDVDLFEGVEADLPVGLELEAVLEGLPVDEAEDLVVVDLEELHVPVLQIESVLRQVVGVVRTFGRYQAAADESVV